MHLTLAADWSPSITKKTFNVDFKKGSAKEAAVAFGL